MTYTDKDLAGFALGIYAPDPKDWELLVPEGQGNRIYRGYRVLRDARGAPLARVLAFRGSLVFLDFLEDADVALVPSPLGLLHQGFLAGVQEVVDEALGLTPSLPLVACGHSLGADRAVNFTGLAQRQKPGRVAACVTWGLANLGVRFAPGAYQAPVTRTYVMSAKWGFEQDPVTRVPLGLGKPRLDTVVLRTPLGAEAPFGLVPNPLTLHSMKGYAALTPLTPFGI